MKKTIFAFSAIASMLAMSACSNNTAKTGDEATTDESGLFTGVLPAADATGIRYSLKLDYGHATDSTAGKFDLEQVYLINDTTATDSVKDGSTFKAKGDFAVMQQDGKKYLKLTRSSAEAAKDSVDLPLYFLVDSDSTITMVNSELQVSSTPGLNYTLTRQK